MLRKVKQMRADKEALTRKRKEDKARDEWRAAMLECLNSILEVLKGVDQDDK